MIKAVIVMLLSVLALPMLAQDKVVLKDDVIKVYIDADNDFYFCQLLPSESDLFYDAHILEKRRNRFKLKITLRDIPGKICSEPITGWVDKNDCGVFVLCNEYRDTIPILFLYEFPDANARTTYIDINKIHRTWMHIEDISNGFVRISFDLDDIKYNGWINRYCLDMFSLCTG
jgi:hypothetical protein